jgi:enoyl-CoA hydratase/carnithine racemase
VIRTEVSGGVLTVRLDRPEKRNALTLGMIETLRDRLREAARDPGVKAVVIAGSRPSTCAGVDLAELAGGTPASIRTLIDRLAEACAAVRACPKPVAMAIQGHCLGAGLELACACDFRVAAPGALLGMPEIAIGIPSVIDAALIERHIGLARAQALILTADPISAERALDWGLVHLVEAAVGLEPACRELLGRVTRHDAAAVGAQKRLIAEWQNLPLDEAIERSKEVLVASFAGGVPQRLAQERLESR